MKPIGGYFELALPSANPTPTFHNGVWVNTGRNALEYILISIGLENIDTIHLPYYTCEVVLEPLVRHNIAYEFYHITTNLEIEGDINLGDKDYLIVNNYFGIKDEYIADITSKYFGKIIVDNSQSLYTPVLQGQQAFYSPRKFMGLPDGGIAYAFDKVEITDIDKEAMDRISHLIKRLYLIPSTGYPDFKENSAKLKNLSLKKMSDFTKSIFDSQNHKEIAEKRKINYDYLRKYLESKNLISTPSSKSLSCPMVYPFMTDNLKLKQELINNQIFVASYWPNVREWCEPDSTGYYLMEHLLPLPIDQRYGAEEMKRIINMIREYGQ